MSGQDLAAIFQAAMEHHRAGRIGEAEQLYRRMLQAAPNHPQALHHLGIIAIQCGKPEMAVQLIGRSLELQPTAAALNNLGEALRAMGRLPEAIDCYRKAIAADPKQSDAMANLGVALISQKQLVEGERWLKQALTIAPNHASASLSLAQMLNQTDRVDDAIAAWERVVRISPGNFNFHRSLGAAWITAGDPYRGLSALRRAIEIEPRDAESYAKMAIAYDKLNKPEESIAAARRAVEFAPENWHAHHDLGVFLQKGAFSEEAAAAFRRAVELNPREASLLGSLGSVLKSVGRLDEAAQAFMRGGEMDPKDARFQSGLSSVRFAQRDFPAAVGAAKAAVKLNPHDVDGHAALAFALLAAGNFHEGFREYEWRWRDEEFTTKPRDFDRPLWDGSDPAGRRILVHCEQGFGDIFQFLRYVPMVRAMGAKVLIEVTYKLAGLVRRMAGDMTVIVSGTMLPDFDLHVPMLSLPAIFRTSTNTIPSSVPYLTGDPGLGGVWESKLGPPEGLRVGLVWSGNVKPDPKRSASLAVLAALEVPGISFIGLQPPPRSADADDPPAGMKLVNVGALLTDLWDPTAYVLSRLDLLITIDSGIVHLAGAMGVPTWVMLPHAYDWRWVLKYPVSAWYPSVRLFHQPAAGDWESVVERIKGELAEWSVTLNTPRRAGNRGLQA